MHKTKSILLMIFLILPIFLIFIPEVKAPEGSGNISFQSNVIPFVNVQYSAYSFTFSYKTFFLRVRPYFGLSNGSVWTLQTAITWLKTHYPNVNLATLVQKLEMKINYGFNVTRLPTVIANNLEWIGFKLIDWNFPLSNFELETVEYVYPNETRINATRINIPKLGLTFSFEDLYPYGYTVQHVNQTWVLIGNIKGKTDLYLDPITYSSNTIMVTGYTEASPASFDSLYTADTSGTLELKAFTAYSTNASYSLTQQVRPAESLALKVKLNVTAVSGSVNVRIVGVDLDSNALTIWLNFTTTGIKTTIGAWYKSVNTNGITVEVNTGESATFKIYQSRWGVVWKQATNSFMFDCRLQIGDDVGTTDSYFADTDKQVVFSTSSLSVAGQRLIDVKRDGYLKFGTVLDAINKGSRAGVQFTSLVSAYWHVGIYTDTTNTGKIYIYSSIFQGIVAISSSVYASYAIWNTIIGRQWVLYLCTNTDAFNVIFSGGSIYVDLLQTPVSVDKLYMISPLQYFRLEKVGTIKNVYGRGKTLTTSIRVDTTSTVYLINADIDSWTFTWNSAGLVYRQYEFDLTTNANSTVEISYYGQGGGTIFNTTDSDGIIPTQTLTKGFYNQTGGNNIYSYEPYNLKISKNGYITYQANFTIIQKNEWQILLIPTDTATSDTYFVLGIIGLSMGIIGVALAVIKKR